MMALLPMLYTAVLSFASVPMCPTPKADPITMDALIPIRSQISLVDYSDMEFMPSYNNGPKLAAEFGGASGFYHGVASGSPLPDSVIIWTRYTPVKATDKIEVTFMMAEGEDEAALSSKSVLTGTAMATPGHDWVVKLDIKGLKAGTKYVFGFAADGDSSMVGHTKTAPPADWMGSLTYAIFACSKWDGGYFHAYDIAAHVKDLDLWVHTGDYIYEYGTGSNARAATGGGDLQPPWEIVTISDYRRRHALYVEDSGLMKLRASAPMIAMWDDHEFTNNPYGNGMGADNHQPECEGNRTHPGAKCSVPEGSFLERANRAAQVYFEWLPIRRGPRPLTGQVDTDLTQVIEWGAVATFLLQDTRIEARPEHGTMGLLDPSTGTYTLSAFSAFIGASLALDNPTNVTTWTADDFAAIAGYIESQYTDPQYELLGAEQRAILEKTFAKSKAAGKVWQIYGSSVVMADQIGPGDMYKLADSHPDIAAAITGYLDTVLPSPSFATFRGLFGMGLTDTSWNPDSWSGFKNERQKVYKTFKTAANNVVVLSGDVHDNWAYTLHDSGEAVGVNIVTGGVTANGWGSYVGPAFCPGFGEETYNLFEESCQIQDPYLKYAGVKDKGFWVIKANATHHVAESILVNTDEYAEQPTNDYLATKPIVEGSLAPFYCDASMVSTAGEVGSLSNQLETGWGCEIQFDTGARRRLSAPKAPPKNVKQGCDCWLQEKLGAKCDCRRK